MATANSPARMKKGRNPLPAMANDGRRAASDEARESSRVVSVAPLASAVEDACPSPKQRVFHADYRCLFEPQRRTPTFRRAQAVRCAHSLHICFPVTVCCQLFQSPGCKFAEPRARVEDIMEADAAMPESAPQSGVGDFGAVLRGLR